jgi:hypothetical protein
VLVLAGMIVSRSPHAINVGAAIRSLDTNWRVVIVSSRPGDPRPREQKLSGFAKMTA